MTCQADEFFAQPFAGYQTQPTPTIIARVYQEMVSSGALCQQAIVRPRLAPRLHGERTDFIRRAGHYVNQRCPVFT